MPAAVEGAATMLASFARRSQRKDQGPATGIFLPRRRPHIRGAGCATPPAGPAACYPAFAMIDDQRRPAHEETREMPFVQLATKC